MSEKEISTLVYSCMRRVLLDYKLLLVIGKRAGTIKQLSLLTDN